MNWRCSISDIFEDSYWKFASINEIQIAREETSQSLAGFLGTWSDSKIDVVDEEKDERAGLKRKVYANIRTIDTLNMTIDLEYDFSNYTCDFYGEEFHSASFGGAKTYNFTFSDIASGNLQVEINDEYAKVMYIKMWSNHERAECLTLVGHGRCNTIE